MHLGWGLVWFLVIPYKKCMEAICTIIHAFCCRLVQGLAKLTAWETSRPRAGNGRMSSVGNVAITTTWLTREEEMVYEDEDLQVVVTPSGDYPGQQSLKHGACLYPVHRKATRPTRMQTNLNYHRQPKYILT